jgi:hypothetical protein
VHKIVISCDNIHLLHAGEGNMKIYSPQEYHIPPRATPEGNVALGGIWYLWVNKFSYFLYLYCTYIIFHHFGSLMGFPARVIVLWQENVRGTRNASFEGDRYNVVFKYLRQRSNGLKICLPAVFMKYIGKIRRLRKKFVHCLSLKCIK